MRDARNAARTVAFILDLSGAARVAVEHSVAVGMRDLRRATERVVSKRVADA